MRPGGGREDIDSSKENMAPTKCQEMEGIWKRDQCSVVFVSMRSEQHRRSAGTVAP